MVRYYQRRSEPVDGETLRAAIRYYWASNPPNQRETCRNFGLTRSVLQKYLKYPIQDIPEECSQGNKPVFSKEMEEEILSYVHALANRFYAMSRQSLAELAYHLAERNNLDHPFKNGTAGNGWLTCFLHRHERQLSLRTGTPTSLVRITAFTRPAVHRFYELLEEILTAKEFSAATIFNMDETGVSIVPSKYAKRIARRGARSVPIMVPVERGKLVTIMVCFSASGNYMPPLFVFPETSTQISMTAAPENSASLTSPKGWSNSQCFLKFLKHLRRYAASSPEVPILLILDNHSSHISYPAVRYCRSHNIELLTLPPHSTHKLQPADVSFFSPLKAKYSEYLAKWLFEHPLQKPRIEDIPCIFSFAFKDAAKPETAINGFRSTGIWVQNPVTQEWGPNRHNFDHEFDDDENPHRDRSDNSPPPPPPDSPPPSPHDSPPPPPRDSPPPSPHDSPPPSPPSSPFHSSSDSSFHLQSDAPFHSQSVAPLHSQSDSQYHLLHESPSQSSQSLPIHSPSNFQSHSPHNYPSHSTHNYPSHSTHNYSPHLPSNYSPHLPFYPSQLQFPFPNYPPSNDPTNYQAVPLDLSVHSSATDISPHNSQISQLQTLNSSQHSSVHFQYQSQSQSIHHLNYSSQSPTTSYSPSHLDQNMSTSLQWLIQNPPNAQRENTVSSFPSLPTIPMHNLGYGIGRTPDQLLETEFDQPFGYISAPPTGPLEDNFAVGMREPPMGPQTDQPIGRTSACATKFNIEQTAGIALVMPTGPPMDQPVVEATLQPARTQIDQPVGNTSIPPTGPLKDYPVGRTSVLPTGPPMDHPVVEASLPATGTQTDQPVGNTSIPPTGPPNDQPVGRTSVLPTGPQLNDAMSKSSMKRKIRYRSLVPARVGKRYWITLL